MPNLYDYEEEKEEKPREKTEEEQRILDSIDGQVWLAKVSGCGQLEEWVWLLLVKSEVWNLRHNSSKTSADISHHGKISSLQAIQPFSSIAFCYVCHTLPTALHDYFHY